MNRSRGWSLVELLTVVALIGTILVVSLPALSNMNRIRAVRAADAELRGVLMEARFRAISESRHIGLRFVEHGNGWAYETYLDGDQDGLRTADIRSGVDVRLDGPKRLLIGSEIVRIGLPSFPIRHPDSRRLMDPSSSPVRFGRSRICSFSPLGSSSSGSIFITDGRLTANAIRVYGPTGRIRTMRYDRESETWR